MIAWAIKAKTNILNLDSINSTIVINTTPIDRAFTFHDIRSGRKYGVYKLDLEKYGKEGVGFMHTKAIDVDQGCVIKYACIRNPDLIIGSLETSVVNIFDANEGNVLAELNGHRGNAPPHLLYVNHLQTIISGGGGQGDANLRVWPLSEFFSSVSRMHSKQIIGKQDGDDMLKKDSIYKSNLLPRQLVVKVLIGVLVRLQILIKV